MKLHELLVVGCALSATGCAEKEQATPAPVEETPQETVIAEAAFDEAFIQHMHKHADMLDELNIALADGDLEAARTPAYWLSRHDSVEGVDAEWQPFVVGMRAAARAVEEAADFDAARTAAEQITGHCQGCHEIAGVIEK